MILISKIEFLQNEKKGILLGTGFLSYVISYLFKS